MMLLQQILLSLLLFAGVMSQGCPGGFLSTGDSCYILIRVRASWAEANTYCSAIGAHLARIETESEQSFLKAEMIKQNDTLVGQGVWIGGQDLAEEGKFRWGFTNDDITYCPCNQLNNHEQRHETQDCLQMRRPEEFLWDDQWCWEKQFFLCEVQQSADVIG